MGAATVETVKQIEETRERLGANIAELEERLPEPAKIAKRVGGIALGGGATGAAFWFVVRRVRGRARAHKKAKRAEVQMVVNVLPDDLAKKFEKAIEDGRGKMLVAGAGGAWLLFRMMELRQLRRLRRVVT
jgi:hypothetical protein